MPWIACGSAQMKYTHSKNLKGLYANAPKILSLDSPFGAADLWPILNFLNANNKTGIMAEKIIYIVHDRTVILPLT